MRSLVYTFLCLLLVMTHFVSCEKKVTIPLPPFEKRLVVFGYIGAGELFNVEVGQTVREREQGMLSTSYVNDALVLLYEDGVLKDTLLLDSTGKKYASTKVIAGTGKPYTIKIAAEGFPTVEATATAPSVPAIQSIKHIRKARQLAGGRYLDDVEFTFQDPGGIRNFYLTELFGANKWPLYCVYSIDPVIQRAKSSLLPLDESDCLNSKTISFTDKSFDGQLKTISLSGETDYFEIIKIPDIIPLPIPFPIYRPYLKSYAIDSAYYNYLKFTSFVARSGIPAIFTENTENKGNITNGYGIFAVYDVRVDSIR